MKQSHRLLLIIFSLLPFGAAAQWAWTDEEGRTVFSDRAPAISVPDKRIFKRPGPAKLTDKQDATANTGTELSTTKMATSAQAVASIPQAAGLDKALVDRKKKSEQAQVEQRKLEEARISKSKADNCARARQAKKTLDSGVRLKRTNASGEREILDDAARADESKRIQSIMASDCN
jgi:hypothetical protein